MKKVQWKLGSKCTGIKINFAKLFSVVCWTFASTVEAIAAIQAIPKEDIQSNDNRSLIKFPTVWVQKCFN